MSAPLVKWHRTGNTQIKRVECVRETDSSVWIAKVVNKLAGVLGTAEIRHSKGGAYSGYHDTWAEAHAVLLERAEGEVLTARQSLQHAQDRLGNIKGMKPPKEGA